MDILAKEQILFNDGLSTKHEVLQLIADTAAGLGLVTDSQALMESFMEREALGMTGMGEGLAIPHAKSACVNRVSVMVVKSKNPIEWESFDGGPVHIAIALMVPGDNADNVHLKVLSGISRKLVNQEFKKNLFEAAAPEDILELFKEFSLEL